MRNIAVISARMLSYLILFVMLAAPAQAADEWTQGDQNLQINLTFLQLRDWGQTRYIARHPDSYQETNPILGSHPSTEQVDMYFASTIVASWLIAKRLDRKYRKPFQWFVTVDRLRCITHNLSIGIGFTW